jgi:transcriptional regulator with XRE-family HTH domain
MSVKNLNNKIILGLKVRQLRLEKGLSFSELSKESGLSLSYLNEIEKGKKFPKLEKIESLANCFNISVDRLLSQELDGALAPVSDLLKSNFLKELPLDLFGIEISKIVEIISVSPKRVGAFISTLVEIARNHAYVEENFYLGALRSFLEMHLNYFEEIESAAKQFRKDNNIPDVEFIHADLLANLLENLFNYDLDKGGLDQYPELNGIRSLFIPKSKTLLLNSNLTPNQMAFQFGKELGFSYLKLKQRANTSSLMKIKSFEEVLSHFKAAYFSAALLMPLDPVKKYMEEFLQQKSFSTKSISKVMNDYGASAEMVFQRMTNILPSHLGLKKIFFFRFISEEESLNYIVDKELHLDGKHTPHSNRIDETYCRRWLSIKMLDQLKKSDSNLEIGAQISNYFGSKDEYLIISIVKKGIKSDSVYVGLSLGILLDENSKSKIGFLEDPAIPRVIVNTTCERCSIEDCEERRAEPTKYIEKLEKRRVSKLLEDLLN